MSVLLPLFWGFCLCMDAEVVVEAVAVEAAVVEAAAEPLHWTALLYPKLKKTTLSRKSPKLLGTNRAEAALLSPQMPVTTASRPTEFQSWLYTVEDKFNTEFKTAPPGGQLTVPKTECWPGLQGAPGMALS